MALGLPLVAWGTAENINSWTSFGTPVITTGQTDPFGGTDGILIEDNDGVSVEGKLTSLGAYTGTTMLIAAMARAGTSASSHHLVRDTTASVTRGGFTFTWSGGVPTVTGVGSTTLFGTVALGGGWYLALGRVNGLTSGNVHERRCYGETSSGTGTGSTYWYLRNLVLLDYLDNPIAGDVPREGSKWVQSYSGVEDAWISGPDYVLSANVRWVPGTPQSTPVVVSGWDGRNEATGVNCGVQAMLRAGRNKSTLSFVPDRSACTTYIDSYLVEPMTDLPSLEENRGPFRTFPFKLRNASTPYEGVP